MDNVLGCLRSLLRRSKNVLKPLVKTARNAKIKVSVCSVSYCCSIYHGHGMPRFVLTFRIVMQTIRALGLICFVCSVEEENTEELLELFETFFNPKIIGDISKPLWTHGD
ncbi:hypothetical protein GQ600_44 [Phytophthora cactorum]|nr:hypothetical protein GQ600_44 [Phytophthora cactorum]